MDNRLAFFDQATFLSLRATGRAQLTQIGWVYEHPLDFDALRRFHRNLGYRLAGRRIERSPLPFGRHRWVAVMGPQSDLDIAERARPRAELADWADERAQALTPFVPKRAVIRAADLLFGFTDFPVICSNLGDLPAEIGRPDGTGAEYVMLRGADQHVTRNNIEGVNGQLVAVGGRLAGKMCINVVAHQPGGNNSKSQLRELVANTRKEFDLTGVIG